MRGSRKGPTQHAPMRRFTEPRLPTTRRLGSCVSGFCARLPRSWCGCTPPPARLKVDFCSTNLPRYTTCGISCVKETGHQKPLFWIGRSYEELLDCPDEVRRTFGFALGLAQTGGKHVDAKPLSGFGGAGVLEGVEDLPERYVPMCLRGEVCRGGVRAARLSEEVESRDQDTEAGNPEHGPAPGLRPSPGLTGGVIVGPVVSLPQCAGPGHRDCHPPDQKAGPTCRNPGVGSRLN